MCQDERALSEKFLGAETLCSSLRSHTDTQMGIIIAHILQVRLLVRVTTVSTGLRPAPLRPIPPWSGALSISCSGETAQKSPASEATHTTFALLPV